MFKTMRAKYFSSLNMGGVEEYPLWDSTILFSQYFKHRLQNNFFLLIIFLGLSKSAKCQVPKARILRS